MRNKYRYQQILNLYGISIFNEEGKYRYIYQILNDVYKIWSNLTDIEKRQLNIAIWGYQSKLFNEIMKVDKQKNL